MPRLTPQYLAALDAKLPPGKNYWFSNRATAQRAAYQTAQQLGSAYVVHNHIYPSLNLRHFHIEAPNGRYLRVRFFYGEFPRLEHEAEVTRKGGKYRILWSPPYTFSQAIHAAKGRGGIYVLEKSGSPIYTGKAKNLSQRLAKRLEYLRQTAVDLRHYRVRLGIIRAKPSSVSQAKARAGIEHTIVRSLRNANKNVRATNISSTHRFRVAPRGRALQISNTGRRRPKYLNRSIRIQPGAYHESEEW